MFCNTCCKYTNNNRIGQEDFHFSSVNSFSAFRLKYIAGTAAATVRTMFVAKPSFFGNPVSEYSVQPPSMNSSDTSTAIEPHMSRYDGVGSEG